MAVQIGMQGYQLRPPPQFLQPPPSLPSASMVTFAISQQMPVMADPVIVQLKQPQAPASPQRTASAAIATGGGVVVGGSFDGRRMRSKSTQRRTVDYNASLVNYVQVARCYLLANQC